MQTTSLKAYAEEIEPTLGYRQDMVLKALQNVGPMTNKETARYLEMEINSITPRMNELVKMGLVGEVDKRHCKITGRTAIVWGLKKLEQARLL